MTVTENTTTVSEDALTNSNITHANWTTLAKQEQTTPTLMLTLQAGLSLLVIVGNLLVVCIVPKLNSLQLVTKTLIIHHEC